MRLNASKDCNAATDRPDRGICAGTVILTLRGEVPVEKLRAGDRVVTRDTGVARLRRVESRKTKLRPIVIKGGSLGHTRPGKDMTVTPDTRIHVRDWRATFMFGKPAASIAAQRLADGEFVAHKSPRQMQVYDLQFDRAHIVYAGGIEVTLPARQDIL